jgi:hypothetical protein
MDAQLPRSHNKEMRLMHESKMGRRDFERLSLAALGGLLVGSSARAADDKKEEEDDKKSLLLKEPHVCRGLNTCAEKGADEKNTCAGMGACATAEKHECAGMNECKGQGGCGEHPGENKCKGMGECAVPLGDKPWAKARKNFEAEMKKAKMKFGPAPKKKKES